MLSRHLSSPYAVAAATFVALELVYALAVGRAFRRLPDRLRFHLGALAASALVFALLSGRDLASSTAMRWLAALALVLGAETVFRVLDRFVLARIQDSRGRPAIPQLVRDIASWLVVVVAIVVAATAIFGRQASEVALPTAVVSAVLGFALQDILKNVFSGLALQTEQPFDVGDWLLIEGEPRQVIEMSWRATHLRNSLGVDFYEPNASLAVGRVSNLGAGLRPVAFAFEAAVAAEATVAEVKAALAAAAGSAAGALAEPAPQALVKRFDDSGIVYELRVWSLSPGTFAALRDSVLGRVAARVAREGWRLAVPGRDVVTAEADASSRSRVAFGFETAQRRLAAVDLFAALPPEAREELARRSRRLAYDTGEAIFEAGAAGDSLLVIDRGRVRIAKDDVVLATLGPGEYFGEMSLLTGEPRSASVRAELPTEVVLLDRSALAPLLERDPALAESLSRRLAERAASTEERLEHHRGALARERPGRDQASLLKRIRGFFQLPARQ